MKTPKHILPSIVIAQFCCTSLWFAGNGVMDELIQVFSLNTSALGHLTSAVQLGFIAGTLLFALLSIADRISPSKVFFLCALLGASINLCTIATVNTLESLLLIRFITGFTLAGIYPVGMKIASDYYQKGLGRSLGYLVGALVLGTALPHLLRYWGSAFPWQYIIYGTSLLAVIGGVTIITFVPDGPYRQKSQKIDPTAMFTVFKERRFRVAAFGYFGHMWELYAFWAFIPVILGHYQTLHDSFSYDPSGTAFLIIAIGGVACVVSALLSERFGVKKIAYTALVLSTISCLLSPVLFHIDQPLLFLLCLLFWGMVVIADSPLFSTLVAHNAPKTSRATALTIVNCIGFSITIFSIQLLNYLTATWDIASLFLLLAIGPILGSIYAYLNQE